jgi:hypothetical protein
MILVIELVYNVYFQHVLSTIHSIMVWIARVSNILSLRKI